MGIDVQGMPASVVVVKDPGEAASALPARTTTLSMGKQPSMRAVPSLQARYSALRSGGAYMHIMHLVRQLLTEGFAQSLCQILWWAIFLDSSLMFTLLLNNSLDLA